MSFNQPGYYVSSSGSRKRLAKLTAKNKANFAMLLALASSCVDQRMVTLLLMIERYNVTPASYSNTKYWPLNVKNCCNVARQVHVCLVARSSRHLLLLANLFSLDVNELIANLTCSWNNAARSPGEKKT